MSIKDLLFKRSILGTILGTLIFSLYMILRYEFSTNDVTYTQINEYMKNSQSYPMIFDSFVYKKDRFNKGGKRQNMNRHQYIFYNKYMGKYFAYYGIDIDAIIEETFAELKNTPFQGKVNNYEINSDKGNSVDNPILVWDIDMDSTLIDEDARKWRYSMYNETLRRKKYRKEKGTDVYLYYYFKLFVPKEEFEKIFPKKE